jgi:hypothetical protein
LTGVSNLTCQNDSRATQNFYLEIRKQLSSSKYPVSSGPEGSWVRGMAIEKGIARLRSP